MNNENFDEKKFFEVFYEKVKNQQDLEGEIKEAEVHIKQQKQKSDLILKQIGETINLSAYNKNYANKNIFYVENLYKEIQKENEQKKVKVRELELFKQQTQFVKKIVELKLKFKQEGLSNKLNNLQSIINLSQVETEQKISDFVEQTIKELEQLLQTQFDLVTVQNAKLYLDQFHEQQLDENFLHKYLEIYLLRLINESNLFEDNFIKVLKYGQEKFEKSNSYFYENCKKLIQIESKRILLKTVENEQLKKLIEILEFFRLNELKQKILQKINFQQEHDNYLKLIQLKDEFSKFLLKQIKFIELDHYLRLQSPNSQNLEQVIPEKLQQNQQVYQYIEYYYSLAFNFFEGFIETFLDLKKEDQILMQNLMKTLSENLISLEEFDSQQDLLIQCLQIEFKIVEMIRNFDELIK